MHINRDNQNLANNIVLIDGFPSSGKSLIAQIFGYLKQSEQYQLHPIFDYLSVLNYINEISNESYKAMICMEADKLLYNLMIGRYVNFRKTDNSSPYYDGLHERYLARIKKNDDNQIINEINNTNPILPIHIHNIFGYSNGLYHSFGDRLKLYLVILRDPFYLIDTWHQRDWVNKICKLDREFILCCDYNGRNIPWYSVEYVEEYTIANSFEKSILTICRWYEGVFSKYNNLSVSEKNKTMLIIFEEFAINPNKYIDIMCSILKTERADNFNKIFERLHLPRDLHCVDSMSFKGFLEKYKKEISNEYLNMVEKLDKDYEKFVKKLMISN
jgi:hypothetical protein